MAEKHLRPLALAVALLLLLWVTRLPALDLFPLHVDEGLYLRRAIKVWELHPFWAIGNGKIISHWPIAAFYPQNAPAFVGRVPTIMLACVGLAAGYALARRAFGRRAAALAGLLWLTSPYLFFFERTALVDAEVGALVVVTLWASLRLARSGRARDAVLTGLALSAATLFKFTAAPFALMVLLVVALVGKVPWRRRVAYLLIIGAVGAVCFAIPLAYVVLRGLDFASTFAWIGGDGRGGALAGLLAANAQRLWAVLWGFGMATWVAALLAGLTLLLLTRFGAKLLLAALLPLLAIMAFGSDVFDRHYVVALPLALTLAGGGLSAALARVRAPRLRWAAMGTLAALLVAEMAPFAWAAYRDPARLTLSAFMQKQYVTSQSAGFGLREAVEAFPQTIMPPDAPVVASMFPDSCRRASFYNTGGYNLICTAAPGLAALEQACVAHDVVFVLVEAPPIGLDMRAPGLAATRVAAYPRPRETDAMASVTLWRVEAVSTAPDRQ